MNVLAGALKTSLVEIDKPVKCVRGDDFEEYVRATLFPTELYDLLGKAHHREIKDNYFAFSKQPDLKFRSKNEGIEFFVETKCRARFQDKVLEWCKFFELKRYQEIDYVTPVLIAIGLGGRPAAPERVFLVPVKHIKFVKLYPSLLQRYEISPGRSVSERLLKVIL